MASMIASTELIVIVDGREAPVTAAIGLPYESDTGEWRCPVSLQGLHEDLSDVAGEDALQALCLAATLLRNLLQNVRARGGQLLDANRSEYSIEATFGRVGV